MKRFYVFWFFFSAGWGYLMSEPFLDTPNPRTLVMVLASFPAGAITFLLLLSVELWRLGPTKKLSPPSLALKPWHLPFGLATFVVLTVLFSSVWGVVFALAKANGQVFEPLHFFMLSAGGLLGMWAAYRIFPSRFSI